MNRKINNKLISDNYKNDKSDRTNLIKDRIVPGLKNKAIGVGGLVGGAMLGAGLGYEGKKIARKAFKAAISSNTSKKIGDALGSAAQNNHELASLGFKAKKYLKQPANILFGPEMAKVRAIAAAGAGAMVVAPIGREVAKSIDSMNTLNKQYINQFGVAPTEDEYFAAAKLDQDNKIHKSIMDFYYTPNSMTKSLHREIAQMDNFSNAIKANNDSDPSNNVQVLPRFTNNRAVGSKSTVYRRAEEEDDSIEKTANLLNELRMAGKSIVNAGQNIYHNYPTIKKVSPIVVGSVTGGLSAPLANVMSKSLVQPDDEKYKQKVLIGTGAGALAGGLLGARIAKDGFQILDSAGHLVRTTTKNLKNVKNSFVKNAEYVDTYKNVIYKYAEFHEECKAKNKRESDNKKIKKMFYKNASTRDSLNFLIGNRKFDENKLDGSIADVMNPKDTVLANKIGDVAAYSTLGLITANDIAKKHPIQKAKNYAETLKKMNGKERATRIIGDALNPLVNKAESAYKNIKNKTAVKGISKSISNKTIVKDTLNKAKKIVTNPKLLTTAGVATLLPATIDYIRGRNLAKTNDTNFTIPDLIKTQVVPLTSPDVVIKAKIRDRMKKEQ